jgi:hypothetical protein
MHEHGHGNGMGRAVRSALVAAWALLIALSNPGVGGAKTAGLPLPGPTLRAEPATVGLGLYEPVFPDDLTAASDFAHRTGHGLAIIHWYALWGGWKSAFNANDVQLASAVGAVPMITWEPWDGTGPSPAWSLRAAILSGTNDDYIDSWAQGLAAYGKPVLLRFAQEMHDQPRYPWAVGVNSNTAADYLAAWQRVRAIFARYQTTNVKWVWSPQMKGDAPAADYQPVFQSVYPGDNSVDWVALDVFNTGPELDWGAPRWRSFGEVLGPAYTAMTALTDKPIILAEVGSSEHGGSKADWITQALTDELPQFPRVRALVWFDATKEHEDAWTVSSSPSAFAAWIGAASQPMFVGDWSP